MIAQKAELLRPRAGPGRDDERIAVNLDRARVLRDILTDDARPRCRQGDQRIGVLLHRRLPGAGSIFERFEAHEARSKVAAWIR